MITPSILLWNIRGMRGNAEELKVLWNEYNPDITCLQETMLNRMTYDIGLNYIYYGSIPDATSTRPKGGAAIVVKSDVSHEEVLLTTPLQAVAVKVILKKQYTICSLYLEPSLNILYSDLEDLINQLVPPFLVVGDLNAHNTLWGCSRTNNKGQIIEKLLNENSICILNDDKPTYYNLHNNATSIIDLGLCSSNVLTDFKWEVLRDLHGSDHFPIIIKLNEPKQVPTIPRWNIDKANWISYREECSKIQEIANIENNLEAYKSLEKVILSAASKSIPSTNPMKGRPPVPWWNKTCKNLRKIALKCYNKYKANPSYTNKIIYQRALAKKKKYFKQAKRQSWQDYISRINTNTPVSSVWNKIRKLSGKFVPKPLPSLIVNNNLISNSQEVAEVLAKHFSKISNHSNYDQEFQQVAAQVSLPDFTSANNEYYNQPFKMKELKFALSKTSNSSPGEDSIQADMIKKLPSQTLELLLKIFNNIWSTAILPPSWNSSVVIPIAKPGKDPKISTSYRPIALTSVMCKVLERMVNLRLVFHLESNKLITASQFGFRKNTSTIDPLLKLSTYIQDGFVKGNHTIGVFFDLEKAYDTTWRKGILLEMFNLGFRGSLPCFIQSFLHNRKLKVRVGSEYSTSKDQQEGVPQGSVLSVVLFLLYINSIVEHIQRSEPSVMCSLYADDLAIYYASTDLINTTSKIQKAVNLASDWAKLHGFRFSPSKTVAIHFCKRIQRNNAPPNITMNDQIINYEPSVKFLGLLFDEHLTWLQYIKQLKNKSFKTLNILKVVSGHDWGSDQQSLLRLYNSLCKSKFNYACQIYSSASKTNLKILDTVHNQALRQCTGAYRTSPIESIYVTAGEKPLNLQREYLSLNFMLKTKSFPHSSSYRILNNFNLEQLYLLKTRCSRPLHIRLKAILEESSLDDVKIHECSSFKVPPWTVPDVNICSFDIKKSNHNTTDIYSLFRNHLYVHRGTTPIYTDGSKTNNAVGCAAIMGQNEYSAKLPNLISSFSAEITAVLLILKTIFNNKEKSSFTIFTDSKSVLNAVSMFYSNDPIVLEIQYYLTKLYNNGKKISFCWSPGHVGIQGNECADKAAKEAASSNTINYDPVPFSDLKVHVRCFIERKFQSHWSSLTNNVKLRSIKRDIKPWPNIKTKCRRHVRVLNRLRIGHTHATHNFLMKTPHIHPICNRCQEILTVKHILEECTGLNQLRIKWNIPNSVSELLGENVNIDNLTSFLRESNFYYEI